jgi:hypothetical protein
MHMLHKLSKRAIGTIRADLAFNKDQTPHLIQLLIEGLVDVFFRLGHFIVDVELAFDP